MRTNYNSAEFFGKPFPYQDGHNSVPGAVVPETEFVNDSSTARKASSVKLLSLKGCQMT